MAKVESNTEITLPGESRDSVGCSPLLGVVMRGGAQVACIPETTIEQLRDHNEGLWLGIGADFISSPGPSCNGRTSVEIFFTINFQEVARLVTPITQGSLFPTIAILTKSKGKGVLPSPNIYHKAANVFSIIHGDSFVVLKNLSVEGCWNESSCD